MASLQLKGVRKQFDGVEVLHGIDIPIYDGEFVVFVGPSGCGKSTLLRLIAGLEKIDTGQLLIDENEVNSLSPRERGIAMVFQSYALYPHMSVYKNMAFGLKTDGVDQAEINNKIHAAAVKLKLDKLMDRKPGQLSGGQRQRVAIGRAIVRDPKVFLFDEPLSNLDAALRVEMRIEIAKLQKYLGTTTIYVTHDQVEAMTLADKIVVLNQGHVEQIGAPMELYHKPDNLFVGGFIGSPAMNVIEARVVSSIDDTVELNVCDTSVKIISNRVVDNQKISLGMRPEHLSLSGEGEIQLPCVVDSVERLGDIAYVYVLLANEQKLIVLEQGDYEVEPGQELSVKMPLDKLHVFDLHGKVIRPLKE